MRPSTLASSSVEEQSHRRLLEGERVDRRVLAPQLREWALVIGERLVDFLWVLVVVGRREPDLGLGELRVCGRVARGLERAGGDDDLLAAKRDPRKAPRPQRLFGQRLDDGALAAPRASRLACHQLVVRRERRMLNGSDLFGIRTSVYRNYVATGVRAAAALPVRRPPPEALDLVRGGHVDREHAPADHRGQPLASRAGGRAVLADL